MKIRKLKVSRTKDVKIYETQQKVPFLHTIPGVGVSLKHFFLFILISLPDTVKNVLEIEGKCRGFTVTLVSQFLFHSPTIVK